MSKPRKTKKRTFRPNPYWLVTGAVAASATALLAQGNDAEANHASWGEVYEAGVFAGGGKMYDDRPTQCVGLVDPQLSICYMSLKADRSGGALDSSYTAAINGGIAKWNPTPTTIFYQVFPYDYRVNDVHIKATDIVGGEFPGVTEFYDYHFLDHPGCTSGDCNDSDGIAAHQPQRWWYQIMYLDASYPGIRDLSPALQETVVGQELGHGLGLGDRNQGCTYSSIMDSSCGVEDVTARDTCTINHRAFPVMYGDAVDSSGQDLTNRTCPP